MVCDESAVSPVGVSVVSPLAQEQRSTRKTDRILCIDRSTCVAFKLFKNPILRLFRAAANKAKQISYGYTLLLTYRWPGIVLRCFNKANAGEKEDSA